MVKISSSMDDWYPLVKDLDVPMPKTIQISIEKSPIQYLVDGPNDEVQLENIKQLRDQIYDQILISDLDSSGPLFLRSDYTSGKHNWLDTCYIPEEFDKDMLLSNLRELIIDNFLKDLWFNSIYVREFLELQYDYKAFNGFPVSNEIRFFVEDGSTICWHNYWPKKSIRNPSVNNWEELWEKQDETITYEQDFVIESANKISSKLPGYWSVDFAQGKNGEWYFIDAAEGIWSYHDPDCEEIRGFSV